MAKRKYDTFWDSPEISGRLLPYLKSDVQQQEVLRLLRRGTVKAIRTWVKDNLLSPKMTSLLKEGVPRWEAEYVKPLFDEVVVGRIDYHDMSGSCEYVLARCLGERVFHRVCNDAVAGNIYKFHTTSPLTREQFEQIVRQSPWYGGAYPGARCECDVASF